MPIKMPTNVLTNMLTNGPLNVFSNALSIAFSIALATKPPKYQIWLTFNGEKEKFQFPVNPEQINLRQGSSNHSVEIVGLGETTIMQEKPAAEVSWSGFFPSVPFSGQQVEKLTPPEEIKFLLKTWMGSKQPCHLIVTQTKINLFCTIEQFDCDERGGAIGELNYDITFKEYRKPTMRQVEVDTKTQVATVNTAKERTDNRVTPRTYTVVHGDSVCKIALQFLGSEARYRELIDLNGIAGPPYYIYSGQVMKLPES